jgi:catechol 2,3-dioxygenase-like lactoylglutathione lyase family enzyme
MLPTIAGLDHVVIAVRDLQTAADAWAQLGFKVSPRGLHSPHMGSGNHTIMFGEDYVELLGVVTPQPHNEPMRRFLEGREGLERCAFTTRDAAAGVAALRERGIAGVGPVEFGRPVPLPGGGEAEARFSVFQWPEEEAPGGVRIFACQHHTREAVWIPELQRQGNGVKSIRRVLVADPEPDKAAAHLARLLDGEARADGAFRVVATGPRRAEIAFAPRGAIADAHPGLDAAGMPERGGAGLMLRTALFRPPAAATGCALVFATD